MKKMPKQRWLFVILVPGLIQCFSCSKNSNPGSVFSAPGYWTGSFFSGATLAILNRADGTGRIYLLTTGSTDTSAQFVKLDGSYNVQGDIYSANFIDTSGSIYVNMESSRTTPNSIEGVFSLNNYVPSANTIETFDFQLVRH